MQRFVRVSENGRQRRFLWPSSDPAVPHLAVPGSNPLFLENAKGLDAGQMFLDIEDAVAPLATPVARENIVDALNEGGWSGTGTP